MRAYSKIILALLGLSLTAFASTAGNVVVKASLDSAYIIMGKKTGLKIEAFGDNLENGRFATNDSAWTDVEISSLSEVKINDLGNGRKQMLQEITIQSFDSGLYTLPPIFYIQGGDTVESNRPILKVVPVPVDSLKTIHDYADVETVDRSIFDYLPDWMTDYGIWILLALLLIGLSIYVYVHWLSKGKIPLIPAKKPVPPYVVAITALNRLHDQHLCERGEERQFYTRLTEILRQYLYGRFGINAMEMTSSQIIKALKDNEETRTSEALMSKILEIADFVKFAKVSPLPDDNEMAFNSAVNFVEDTRPVELEASAENDPKES